MLYIFFDIFCLLHVAELSSKKYKTSERRGSKSGRKKNERINWFSKGVQLHSCESLRSARLFKKFVYLQIGNLTARSRERERDGAVEKKDGNTNRQHPNEHDSEDVKL